MRVGKLIGFLVATVLFYTVWHCPSSNNSGLRICKIVNPWWEAATSNIEVGIRTKAEQHIQPLRAIYAAQVDAWTPRVGKVTCTLKRKAADVLTQGPLKPVAYHTERILRQATEQAEPLKLFYEKNIIPLGLGTKLTTLSVKLVDLSKVTFKKGKALTRHIVSKYLLPAWHKLYAEITRLLDEFVWPRVRQFNEQVVTKQVRKILDHLEARQKSASAAAASTTAPASPVPVETDETAASSVESTAPAETTETTATTATTVTETETVIASASATAEPEVVEEEQQRLAPNPARLAQDELIVSHERINWTERVDKTVHKALESMEEDAQLILNNTLAEAKPDIVELLRDISKRGIEINDELVVVVDDVEKGVEKFASASELYRTFEDRSRELAEMALKVRDRSQELAESCVENIAPVRLVTLEAIDDYFDVVLLEAARQVAASSDGGDWQAWKSYHDLKEMLTESRKIIEEHEFNVNLVNQALRESQEASVFLVQDINQRLQDLRAQCQLALQERSVKEAKEKYGDSDQVEDAEYYVIVDEEEEEEEDATESNTSISDEEFIDIEVETIFETATTQITKSVHYEHAA